MALPLPSVTGEPPASTPTEGVGHTLSRNGQRTSSHTGTRTLSLVGTFTSASFLPLQCQVDDREHRGLAPRVLLSNLICTYHTSDLS